MTMRLPRLPSSPRFFHASTNRRMYRLDNSGEITPWTQKITFVGSIILRGSERTGWASVATGKSRGGWDRMANGDAVISDHDLLDEQSGNALTISYIEGLSIAVQTRQERR